MWHFLIRKQQETIDYAEMENSYLDQLSSVSVRTSQ